MRLQSVGIRAHIMENARMEAFVNVKMAGKEWTAAKSTVRIIALDMEYVLKKVFASALIIGQEPTAQIRTALMVARIKEFV